MLNHLIAKEKLLLNNYIYRATDVKFFLGTAKNNLETEKTSEVKT